MTHPRLPFGRTGANDTPEPSLSPIDPVFVRHRRAKRYVLRVRSDGTVRVTIPRGGSTREARAFAERERAWIAAELNRGALERPSSADQISSEARVALRERARRELPTRLLELAAPLGLTVCRISVRNQRWRWGSCSRTGHICLNWRLVQMPPWVRDYVLIHELMHLKRLDHSRAFWKLVAVACPSYKEARAWLRSVASVEPQFLSACGGHNNLNAASD